MSLNLNKYKTFTFQEALLVKGRECLAVTAKFRKQVVLSSYPRGSASSSVLLVCLWLLLDLWDDCGWAAWGDWLAALFWIGKAPLMLGCPMGGAGLVGGILLFTVIAKGAMLCALFSGETETKSTIKSNVLQK